jgi:formate dehydrogenase iron-sulfur subunit
MEWNDLRDDIGTCTGSYDNPPDLSPNTRGR